MGFIGLFVGAVILSIGFKLFQAWLDELAQPDTNDETEGFPGEKSKAVG
jgi:predicted PurR-regulated permease PerM